MNDLTMETADEKLLDVEKASLINHYQLQTNFDVEISYIFQRRKTLQKNDVEKC